MRLPINEFVVVHDDPPTSCDIVIRCDDRTGAGLVLEKMFQAGIAQVPSDWLQILERQLREEEQ